MAIGHIGITVSNLEQAKALYLAALKPLGYQVVLEFPGVVGLGADGIPDFWLKDVNPCPESKSTEGKRTAHTGVHVAFSAKSREVVHEFHAAAL
jgi:catechol 2,3-dioxygenase-like lactoylglutathione lyase family enzyme